MRSVAVLILAALVTQAHTKQPNYTDDEQDFMDKVADKLVDQMQGSMDESVDNLFERALETPSVHHAALDNTTLGKHAHLAASPRSMQTPLFPPPRATVGHKLAPQTFSSDFTPRYTWEVTPGHGIFYSCPTSCGKKVTARGSTRVKAKEAEGEYNKMVEEGRMITVEESKVRYAGAAAILLTLVYKYIGMQAAGAYDYSTIAVLAAGAYLLFESGRQSF